VEDLEVGTLIEQRDFGYGDYPDLGIVLSLKLKEESDDYIQIYWFDRGAMVKYLVVEAAWYFWGDEQSIWEIVS